MKDLRKLPILTKEIIRENYKKLTAKNIKKNSIIESHTSGSTGKPLRFILDKESNLIEAAHTFRGWSFGGYKLGDKVAFLRSYVPKDGEPLMYIIRRENIMYVSAYHLSDDVMRQYADAINRFGSKLLIGYPSSIYIFADFLKRNNIRMKNINAIVTSSEMMLPQYREKIESVFNIKVLDWYGSNEHVLAFSQCENNMGYHINSEYGILEVVDENENLVENGAGSIIGTSLNNYAMPFIRYRTGDLCEKKLSQQCNCGRGLPIDVLRVHGRSDEILNFLGRSIPPINFYTLFYNIPNIIQFQLIQESAGSLIAKFVVSDSFSDDNKKAVTDGLASRIGQGVKLELQFVDKIERNVSTGKIKCIINNFYKK
ncbi:MAG: hypothetical protein NTY22_07035 [Proteobacteria bacterium]|nr:hypothetical protein [Pseudomonadota bacterium]